jgi:hypothetical protein
MKSYFLSRHIREKILLLAIIAFAIALWGSKLYSRTNDLRTATKKADAILKEQTEEIANLDYEEQRKDEAIRDLDPAKSYDNLKLISHVTAIAEKVNLNQNGVQNTSFQAPIVTKLPLMNLTKMRLQLSNVEMADVVNFYRELANDSPYISIAQFRITAANTNNRGGGGATRGGGAATSTVGQLVDGVTSVLASAAGGGGRGGRGNTTATTTTATTGGRAAVNRPSGPPGSRLNVTIDLTAVAINSKAPAAKPAAAPKPAT